MWCLIAYSKRCRASSNELGMNSRGLLTNYLPVQLYCSSGNHGLPTLRGQEQCSSLQYRSKPSTCRATIRWPVQLVIRLKCFTCIIKYTKAKITLVALNGIAKIITSKPPLPDRPFFHWSLNRIAPNSNHWSSQNMTCLPTLNKQSYPECAIEIILLILVHQVQLNENKKCFKNEPNLSEFNFFFI